jgi:putative salt-induced outer membrane protein YdiY
MLLRDFSTRFHFNVGNDSSPVTYLQNNSYKQKNQTKDKDLQIKYHFTYQTVPASSLLATNNAVSISLVNTAAASP